MNVLLLAFSTLLAAGNLDSSRIQGKVTVAGARDHRDVVVYIDKIPGAQFAPPSVPVILDQKNLVFVPHVLPVIVGTKVAFPNSDEIRHNVFSPSSNAKFNLGSYPRNNTMYRVFDKPGPVTLLCNVHAEMSAYVVVTETPYFAKTDGDGNFTIAGVPPGEYTLRFWHERAKAATLQITVAAGEVRNVTMQLRK